MTEDDVLITEQLFQRSPRSPNLESENRILRDLGRQINKPAQALLKHFTEIAKDLCQAGTAGVSLIETAISGEEVFRWVALAGAYEGFEGGATPRDFSPCGVCLRRGSAQLYSYPARYFTYLQQAEPPIVEGLVVPLVLGGRSLGTIWILSHDEQQQFDSEDLRIMTSLADFLAAALANARLRQTIEESARREQIARESAEAAQAQLESVLSSVNDSFVVVDVAEREQVQALERSEERFRQMADIIEAVFWLSDVVEQKIIYVSPAYERIWGRDRQRLYTHPNEFIESIHPDDRERVQSAMSNCILQERYEVEYRVMRPDGEVRWVRDRGFLIRRNGKPYQIAGFAEDITEHKQTELLLIEQKRLLEMTASGYPLDECLSSMCTSIAKLDPGVRACILPTDAQRLTFPRSITPDFPPSFGQGLKDAPINELCIGTCGEAVYCGQPVACTDIANDDRWSQGWRDLCVAHGILGCHSEPILGVDDKPLGSLMLCFDKARQPTEWEYRLADFGTHIASIVFERDRANLALRQNEERLKLAVEAVKMVAWEWNPFHNTIITTANFPQIYGLNEIQTAEQGFALVHPEDRSRHQATIENAVATSSSYYSEFRFIRPDNGAAIWLEERGKAVLDSQGSLQKLIGVTMDITERKQAEEALRDNEERFRNMADNAPVMIWVTDATGYCTYLSRSWYDFSGQTEETGLGYGWLDVVHPEDSESSKDIFLDANKHQQAFQLEYRLRRKDGKYRTCIDAASPWFGIDGQFKGYIGSVIDISERKQAEEDLRRSEERYRTLFETIDEGFCAIEVLFDEHDTPIDYRFLEVNPAFEKQTGLEQAQGKTARQLVPNLEAYWFEIYGKVALTGEPIRFENGSREMNRWFDVYAFRIGQPENRKVALIFQDISTRKQAELQLQHQAKELTELNQSLRRTSELLAERNQELNSFTYTVSHDLKAPLRAIANLSQWIADDLEGRLDKDNQRQIQLLQSRVERMGAMIDGLLAYSRVGRTEVETQSVDVGVLLEEILDSLAPPSTFTIKIPSELPTLVGKRLLLSQVFSNLISNAIKHHPRPDGRIEIAATQKGQAYEFAIADDGAGIAPENHEKIFSIFQVLNSRDVKESTGIGLAIVKKIVETEGGAITLESELGSGATFRFTWPKQSLTHQL